jgi:transposase
VGKKRLRVETLLAATALPSPPPDPAALLPLLPDPTCVDLLPPDDPVMQRLLAVLPQADVYLQDEVQLAFHPTLTRVWGPVGRRGQRLVQAPGDHAKRWGFGLVDWRDGWLDWAIAERRAAAPFCAQLRRAVERSRARGRVALVVLDNLGIHTPRRSRLLRALVDELKDDLLLLYTPAYDPDSNRIEWLWRALRRAVTHNHQRATFAEVLADADGWAAALTPNAVLLQLGSPFAHDPHTVLPTHTQEPAHAA